ncbi:MAG TPA: DUF2804 family protein [Herpetosiphonaceae bacterium]
MKEERTVAEFGSAGAMLDRPYRGDGTDQPQHLPLPPAPLPLFFGGRLRKMWRYVSIWSADLMVCAGSIEVGPVRQEFWAVWDRGGQRLWERTRFLPCCVQLPPGRVLVQDGGVTIDVALDENTGLQVVTPTGRAYTWTRKQIVRAHGSITLHGVSRRVEAVALIDDNAGYHPRHTHWYWSGGAGLDQHGRSVAWSLIVGLNDSPVSSERTIWIDGVPHEVGPVRFTGDLSAVAFAEGGALGFTAEAVRQRRDNLVLIRSEYRQPFGRFAGTLPGDLRLRDAFGVMEEHTAVW